MQRVSLLCVVRKTEWDRDEEGALVARVARKDRKAFETLYYRYSPRIGSYLMRLLRKPDLVDEAVNDVMMVLWENAARFDSDTASLASWLLGIAHNKGLKFLERNRRRANEVRFESGSDNGREPMDDLLADDSPERTVTGWRLGDTLNEALSSLSPEHRAVIELCFGEGCSYEEMSQILGCPVGTVKTRVFYARKRLAVVLRGWGVESSTTI